MSWEAWGSGDAPGEPYEDMEGLEESYEEELQCSHEARVLLADALGELRSFMEFLTLAGYTQEDGYPVSAVPKKIDEWLDANTPKLNQSETWRAALARQIKERSPQS